MINYLFVTFLFLNEFGGVEFFYRSCYNNIQGLFIRIECEILQII